MRRISVFGVTGSVGESTFDLLMRQGGAQAFHTVALTGGRNVARLVVMARAAFNAARDVALDRFIAGRIGFTTRAPLVEATLARVSARASLGKAASGLEDVLAMDQCARRKAVEVARVMARQA